MFEMRCFIGDSKIKNNAVKPATTGIPVSVRKMDKKCKKKEELFEGIIHNSSFPRTIAQKPATIPDMYASRFSDKEYSCRPAR